MMDRMPFLKADNITKSFYGVKALNNVDIEVYPGEVIGVIGENGAGKSTLMKILSGAYSFESGEVFIEGEKINIVSPLQMNHYGISMVYQDTKLIPELKVYQNIYLCNEYTTPLHLTDDVQMREKSQELLGRIEIDVDVDAYVKYLTISQKQSVEIAKAISKNSKLLILDEPTSSLTLKEVERLFNTVNEIKKSGVAVVFISHRISELMMICDRFVVLRDGMKVGEVDRKDATEQVLANMMVGRLIEKEYDHLPEPESGDVILSIKHLSSKKYYHDISFDLHNGEILGFYGIEGNGQRELLRTICGLVDEYEGDIVLEGETLKISSPRHAIDSGITFITNDRHKENVFLPLSIEKNLTVPNLAAWVRNGFISDTIRDEKINNSIEQFSIKTYGPKQPLQELSGGNQQKVSIAGRFLQDPKVFIFDESTFGVDVGAKSEIYGFIKELTRQGVGVIVLSSDMTEILRICDRIIVIGGGQIQDQMLSNEASESRIINAAVKRTTHDSEEAANEDIKKRSPLSYIILKGEKLFPVFAVSLVFLAMLIFGGMNNPVFVSANNMALLMWQAIPIIFITIGQSIVLLTGHIDLSIGQTVGLMTCVISYCLASNQQIFTGLFILVLVSIGVGLLNSFIVIKMKVPHFIGTLSTQTVILGISLILRTVPGGGVAPVVKTVSKFKIGKIWPVSFFIVVAIVAVAEVILQRTRSGIAMRATGSFREAAFYSGINTNRMRTLAYILSALCAAFAGIFLAVRLGGGDPNSGNQLSFQAVTSAVIGGIALSGGKGTFVGATLGAILMVTILNFLNMMQISTYYQYVFMGMMIFVSVAFYLLIDKYRQKLYLK